MGYEGKNIEDSVRSFREVGVEFNENQFKVLSGIIESWQDEVNDLRDDIHELQSDITELTYDVEYLGDEKFDLECELEKVKKNMFGDIETWDDEVLKNTINIILMNTNKKRLLKDDLKKVLQEVIDEL